MVKHEELMTTLNCIKVNGKDRGNMYREGQAGLCDVTVKIGGKILSRYGDDIVLKAETEQQRVDATDEASSRKGLKLNVKKTKTMVISKHESPTSVEGKLFKARAA